MTKPDRDPFGLNAEQDRKFDEMKNDLEQDAAAAPATSAAKKATKPKGAKKGPRGVVARDPEPPVDDGTSDPRAADAGELRVTGETLGEERSEDFLDGDADEVERRRKIADLEAEQHADDTDHREQGDPAATVPAAKDGDTKRERDPLDDWTPLSWTEIDRLKPRDRRIYVRGLVGEATQILAGINSDVKKRGMPFEADLELVARLCGAAAEISSKTDASLFD